MSTKNARLLPKRTAVPGRIPTGTTGDESNLIKQGELAVNTADKKIYSFDGSDVFEFGSNSYLPLNGGILNGDFYVNGDTYLQMVSATTIYLDTKNIYDIFDVKGSEDITRVQPGINITTGGTANSPVVNLVDSPFVNNLTASGNTSLKTVSATTIISGITNLYDIFQTIGSDLNKTYVQNGLNTYTGGTEDVPTVNISAATLDNLMVSGNTILEITETNNLTVHGNLFIEGTTFTSHTENVFISANTITLNYGEINSGITKGFGGIWIDRGIAEPYAFEFVELGQTFRIGTTGDTEAVATREDNPISNGFAYWNVNKHRFDTTTSITGSTFISGSTDLYNIFELKGSEDITRVQPGSNIETGGTSNNPIINLISSPSVNNLIASGNTNLQTVSATTIISGITNLYDIFQTIGSDLNKTYVQNGLNTYTGGTSDLPTVNISSATLNTLFVSGDTLFNTLSATTFYSGSTNFDSILNQNEIKRMFFGAGMGVTIDGATRSIITATGTEFMALAGGESDDQKIGYNFIVPVDYVSGGTFYIRLMTLATINNIYLQTNISSKDIGDDISIVDDSLIPTAIQGSSTNYKLLQTSAITYTNSVFAANKNVSVRIYRDGGHVLDTYDGEVYIYGLVFEYVGSKIKIY